jgi:hypothetical protein
MNVLDHYPPPPSSQNKVLDKVSFEVFGVAACARSSMDRASDFGSEGWGFKSLRAHQETRYTMDLF